VARTVLNSFNPGYSRKVHILANRLEERFHGTPSGIDTGMASDTGTAAWIKNKDTLPVREALSLPRWHIIYAALPRKAPTGDSVAALRRLKEAGDPGVNGAMEKLGRISGEFIHMVKDAQRNESGFAHSAANLAAEAQNLLGSLGLSTVELDEILNLAGELGASGGKLSGGGMGGAFYICTGGRELRDNLLRLLPGRIKARGIRLTVPLSPLDFGRKESG
jgi:mevalonate kinase